FRHFTAFHLPYMKYFQSLGAEVYAMANNEDINEMNKLKEMGIKCLIIPFERSPLRINNFRAYLKIKKIKRKIQFDLIHTHTPVASFLTRLAYRNTKNTKILYTSHGFHFYKGASKTNWMLF